MVSYIILIFPSNPLFFPKNVVKAFFSIVLSPLQNQKLLLFFFNFLPLVNLFLTYFGGLGIKPFFVSCNPLFIRVTTPSKIPINYFSPYLVGLANALFFLKNKNSFYLF